MNSDASQAVRRYEGLIRATARRIEAYVELDFDDIEQRLRIKVWRALLSYDPRRSRLPEDRYVVSCVFNEKKDILNLRRRGDIGIDALMNAARREEEGVFGRRSADSFEAQYLATTAEQVFGCVEDDDLRLPSTLTELELEIVLLLYTERYQTEVAVALGLSKGEIERAMRSIRVKLADWRPAASVVEAPLPQRRPHECRRAA